MCKTLIRRLKSRIIVFRVMRAIRRWEKRFPYPDSVRLFAKAKRDMLWMVIMFENVDGDILDHLILEKHRDGRLVLRK